MIFSLVGENYNYLTVKVRISEPFLLLKCRKM